MTLSSEDRDSLPVCGNFLLLVFHCRNSNRKPVCHEGTENFLIKPTVEKVNYSDQVM